MKRLRTAGLALAALLGLTGSIVLFPHVAGARVALAPASNLRVELTSVSGARASAANLHQLRASRVAARQHRYRTTGRTVSRVFTAGRYRTTAMSFRASTAYRTSYGTVGGATASSRMGRYVASGVARTCPHMTRTTTGK